MSDRLDAWRKIAHRDHFAAPATLKVPRSVLRDLFDEMDARAERAEADADRLAHHLRQLCDEMYAERYEMNRPCRGCYQAVIEHDEAKAQR